MRAPKLRARPAITSLLAATAATLGLAVSAGVAAPAASASVRPTCTWQPLSLINGWGSANAEFGTGDPSYCVENGIVYLSGSLGQATPGSDVFANLPKAALPTSTLYLPVYNFAGSTGSLTISSTGTMSAWNVPSPPNTAAEFTSLAGISFPAAGAALTKIALNSPWQSADGAYGTGDPSYVIKSGIAYLAGSATTPTNQTTLAANVPAIAPDNCIHTNAYAFNGHIATVFIAPTGSQIWVNNDNQGAEYDLEFTSLAGVAYPVAGANWQPLTLQNGWTAATNPDCAVGAPSYDLSNGVVYLSGSVSSPTGSGSPITLPQAAWPTHWLYFTVNTGQGHASLSISPNGQVTVFGGPQPDETSLSGISYQVSS